MRDQFLHRFSFAMIRAAVLLITMGTVQGVADLISREQALAVTFPGAEIKAETVFLTEAQRKEAGLLSGLEIPSALMARYRAVRGGQDVGRGYVDTHVVRSKKESLLIMLDAQGTLVRVEVTAFLEPPEYKATPIWYRQYGGKNLNDDLNLDRSIHPIAGATLTARATNQAVRRILAVDRVLERKAGNP